VVLALALAIGLLGGGYLYWGARSGVDMEDALRISGDYLDLMDGDLEVSEIMEFEYNFYVVFSEQSTGMGAFEMLIDKETGRIYPEYGPNMMWNLKYGHGGMRGPGGMMGGYQPGGETLSEEEALQIAQAFLDQVYPGSKAEDPFPFYGYYTVHSTRGGRILGMLSVNSVTGEVWYHNWHGRYLGSAESH